jgi:hypothetical protein
MSEDSMSYAAKCPGCGHVVALTLDTPKYRKDTAKVVAAWIADGLAVERIASEEGRKLFNGCECVQPLPETLPLFELEPAQ